MHWFSKAFTQIWRVTYFRVLNLRVCLMSQMALFSQVNEILFYNIHGLILTDVSFYPIDLAREVFLAPWESDSSTCRREKSGVSFKPLAPLDTRRQMVKWACLCVVLHSFVSFLLFLNEVLAALDKWRFGDSKGPCVDLLFLKQILAWLKKQNLFLCILFHLPQPWVFHKYANEVS